MGDDEVARHVHHRLHVVADHARAAPAGGHRAGIRIGQRDLLVFGRTHLVSDRAQLAHLSPKLGDLGLQVLRAARENGSGFAIGPIELGKVVSDAVLELLRTRLELAFGEVLVPGVRRLEHAAVDGHDHVLD